MKKDGSTNKEKFNPSNFIIFGCLDEEEIIDDNPQGNDYW